MHILPSKGLERCHTLAGGGLSFALLTLINMRYMGMIWAQHFPKWSGKESAIRSYHHCRECCDWFAIVLSLHLWAKNTLRVPDPEVWEGGSMGSGFATLAEYVMTLKFTMFVKSIYTHTHIYIYIPCIHYTMLQGMYVIQCTSSGM